jgi:hypothetical protein
LDREALGIQRRVLGTEHPETIDTLYDLSCRAASQGRKGEAHSLLGEAVDQGLSPSHDIEPDLDLKSLHSDPRFAVLVAHSKEAARAKTATDKQKPN